MLLIRPIKNLLDFQTGISVAVCAAVEIEKPVSHTRNAAADTVTSFQGSGGVVVIVSEVHDLCTMIHDILYKAVS